MNRFFYEAQDEIVKALQLLKTFMKSRLVAVYAAFDVRDFFVFGGLAMLGYGLYLLRPWIGWSVAGLILMTIGLFIGKRGK